MFRKIAFTFGIKIIIAVLNLAIVVMLSRYTGAAGKGEASLIITTIAMILLFCNMVGGASLVYFVPRKNILQLFLLSNIWSLFVCGAAYFIFEFFPVIDSVLILPVIILSLLNSLLATNLNILLGKEKIDEHNLVSLLQTGLSIIVLWLMAVKLNEHNVMAYIYSLYAAFGICFTVSFLLIIPFIRDDKTSNEKGLTLKLFQYGLYSQAGHVMKFASFRCTYYMLADSAGDVMLGIFSNGISLVESVLLISNSISTILYPKVSNSNDPDYSKELSVRLTRLSIILCLAAIVILVVLPPEFFVWLFGSEFRGVDTVIRILAPGILFYNIALVLGHYFSGIGQFRVNTFANLTGLLTTVICAMLWYPRFGITEISIISTISYLTTAGFIMVYFSRQTGSGLLAFVPRINDVRFLITELQALIKKSERI
jgi:O-antigen/teichoic acid export membrane protein